MSITFCQLIDQIRPKTGNPLAMFFLSILLILFHPNISNKLYNGTGEDQLSAQHKIRTGECCLGETCVRSWSRYDLKRGIPWHFFVYLYFIQIMSSAVVLYHTKNTKTFKIPA